MLKLKELQNRLFSLQEVKKARQLQVELVEEDIDAIRIQIYKLQLYEKVRECSNLSVILNGVETETLHFHMPDEVKELQEKILEILRRRLG